MSRSHIFQVPFPGSGHAVNMFNVGVTLGQPDLIVHVLVQSRKNAEMWLKATGQAPNPNLHIKVIADGKWEDWHPKDPRDLVMTCLSPEFTSAISDAIQSVRDQFTNDRHTAIVFNGLMGPLIQVANTHNLKAYLLGPTPYYMVRLAGGQEPDGSSKFTDKFIFKGIGGSTTDMQAELGDAPDLMSDMYHKMFKPTSDACDGIIYSNTNEGLEGSNYLQPHEPDCNKQVSNFMIGPILPPLYERALDDPEALKAQLATADQSNSCIQFLNSHPPKSVVYVALGSHAELEIDQALLIISKLRKYKQPWILLFREDSEALEQALGEHPDGTITTWAPQLEILLHPSTKCVLSHGGFGTMVEGVFAGQPFITSPMTSDQFVNTRVLLHLGIGLGNIAINKYETVMSRAKLTPRWPDDNGKTIEEVFERAFGHGGDDALEKARSAALALRTRMIEAKNSKGAEALAELKREITESRVATS